MCGSQGWEDSRGLLLHPPALWQNQLDLVMETAHLPRYSHPDFIIIPVREFLEFAARYIQDVHCFSCQ